MTPYRILHCADLHLDRAFVERDLARSASARRSALRDAFVRIVERARTCDALVIAGDLYEHEHVTGDTANMLAHAFDGARLPGAAAAGEPRPAPARLGLRAHALARERPRLPALASSRPSS